MGSQEKQNEKWKRNLKINSIPVISQMAYS